ncbi:MAG: heme o synthase [Pseudarthrobacter sp.]
MPDSGRKQPSHSVKMRAPARQRPPAGHGRKARAYLALTKPRVMELLLVTTLPTMVFAQSGFPSPGLIAATLAGGAFAAGSAGSFNNYFDRDIDKVMHRTGDRPLVTGDITPRQALAFSWILAVLAVAVLWFGANPLAAVLGIAAIFLYVVLYTLVLKRRSTQNIIWGGTAGAMPVLIAWAAVTGTVGWPAAVLFLVIFLWTPAHYWPLSMKYKDDYRAANVPMLGAVAGARAVSGRVLLYTWATVCSSLLLVPAGAGWVYTCAAVLSGAWFLHASHRLYARARRGPVRDAAAMTVFHASITYLTLLFLALAADPFIGPRLF